ncbi:MAG: hypothetical protein B6I35_10795 [Anaerolineaceae bacterium 4572_32.2]|nr:MAG: hypothetical protein B6I35_10795 [Anaerolineaceae bacterium 4572_32.2]
MKCQQCGSENHPDARFCRQCGRTLPDAPSTVTCLSCGTAAKPGARFCRKCGQTLPVAPSAPPRAAACPDCGATVKPGVNFCPHCGQRLAAKPTPPAAPPAPPSLHPFGREIHIEGGVSGQVAIGNNILQIGDVHGGVVNVAMPEQKPQIRPRPTPVSLLPRPFPGLLDREKEINAARAAFQAPAPVEFHGQEGVGKTALLRRLARHPAAASLPDGVVYLSACDKPVEDLLQFLYDAFYECDVTFTIEGKQSGSFKPTEAELRHALQDKQALILLDDVELDRGEVEALMDATPACAFVLGSPERRLWEKDQAMELGGLPPKDALTLVERRLGRPLTSQERPAARALCTALRGHPLHLIQAAALAREKGLSLTEVARQARTPSPVKALATQVLDALSKPERQILAVLALLKETSLPAEHLAAITGLADVGPASQMLLRRGLAQAHSPRYSLTGDLAQTLEQKWNLAPWGERALAHFTAWAEGQQQTPNHLLEEADAILQTLKWAVGSDRWAEVVRLGRAIEGALALGGRWGAWAQVLRWILQAAQAVGEQAAEAWAMHQLGTQALCLGDTSAARSALTKALRLREALGNEAGVAITKHNLSLLLAPPAPPKKPPKKPPKPPATTGVPALVKGAIALVTVSLLALGGWGIWRWLQPTPTPPVIEITVAPAEAPTPIPTSPPPTEAPPPTEVPAMEEPWVVIELADGCYREYERDDYTILFVEANVEGRIEIWLDDTIFEEIWLAPGEVWEREWPFENLQPGGHAFWALLFDPDGNEVSGAECPFDVAPPAPTQVTPSSTPTIPPPTPVTPTPTPYPCVDFNDLPVDSSYYDETFTSRGTDITVRDGSVVVGDNGNAGGTGNELDISYATLDFDFDGPISGLTLRFDEGSGSYTIQINGALESFNAFAELDGRTIGGATASVSGATDEFGYYHPGVLQLDGTINSFVIGGDYLYVDDVCPW